MASMYKPTLWANTFVAVMAIGVAASAQTPAQRLDALADRFVDQALAHDPTLAYEAGLATESHGRFADRTSAALQAFDQQERADLRGLRRLDPASLPPSSMATYATLREKLESDLELRVCRTELWDVNHFTGWQAALPAIAEAQPVGTAGERAQALRRWSSLPAYVDVEIANLNRGLAQGYSAPRSVVRRVINQIDGLMDGEAEASPFFSPAARSDDAAFKAAFGKVIADRIQPALRRYREFLNATYLPRAREGVAVSDLPAGSACYRAFLRRETTLARSPREVFELGNETVARNSAEVLSLGRKLYGASDISSTLAAARTASGERLASKDELLAFSRSFLDRAKSKTATSLMVRLPEQEVVVEPMRAADELAGVSSHLDPQPDISKPAAYRIQLGDWAAQTRAEAEIVVAHETWPGHHLQIALARELSPPTRLSKLVSNAAYREGWARYAEGMAEEVGLYDTPDASILRRIWPARGMVVDPGLHAFHWTRDQAIQYLVSTGRYTRKSADDTVDRIAAMPGQLTAYDSGALEIQALREEAKRRLGDRFDLKAFNRTVLEEGVVPLSELHREVMVWLDRQAPR